MDIEHLQDYPAITYVTDVEENSDLWKALIQVSITPNVSIVKCGC